MDMKNRESFAQKMVKLKKIYDGYLNEWRGELERYEENAEKWTQEDVTELQMTVHKLSGTGSTYGYPEITNAARALEYKLAYANLEFKMGKHPAKNPFILNELRVLIRLCNDAYSKNESARLEQSIYGDEIDEIIQTESQNLGSKTILVVDDQDIVRDMLATDLKAAGFNVITAADGDDALLIMQRKMPDLVILDRMMPHLDGMTVLKTMRKLEASANVPVIFLTAMYSPEDVIKAEKLGAVDYVAKPFDRDEFVMRCIRLFQKKK